MVSGAGRGLSLAGAWGWMPSLIGDLAGATNARLLEDGCLFADGWMTEDITADEAGWIGSDSKGGLPA